MEGEDRSPAEIVCQELPGYPLIVDVNRSMLSSCDRIGIGVLLYSISSEFIRGVCVQALRQSSMTILFLLAKEQCDLLVMPPSALGHFMRHFRCVS